MRGKSGGERCRYGLQKRTRDYGERRQGRMEKSEWGQKLEETEVDDWITDGSFAFAAEFVTTLLTYTRFDWITSSLLNRWGKSYLSLSFKPNGDIVGDLYSCVRTCLCEAFASKSVSLPHSILSCKLIYIIWSVCSRQSLCVNLVYKQMLLTISFSNTVCYPIFSLE